jgi:hypothetical protein
MSGPEGSGSSRPEAVVTAVLAAIAELHRGLYDCASAVWDRYDFGNFSSLLRDLQIEPADGAVRVELSWRIVTAPEEGSGDNNEVHFVMSLEASEAGIRVESSIKAFLDVAVGGFEPGSQVVLHHSASELLDLVPALSRARSDVAALRGLDDPAAVLGYPVS